MTTREAIEAIRLAVHNAGGDPYGVRTIDGARAAYVRSEIDVAELERRVDLFLRAEAGQIQVAILEPGERVLSRVVHTAVNTGTPEGQNVR